MDEHSQVQAQGKRPIPYAVGIEIDSPPDGAMGVMFPARCYGHLSSGTPTTMGYAIDDGEVIGLDITPGDPITWSVPGGYLTDSDCPNEGWYVLTVYAWDDTGRSCYAITFSRAKT
jgi:hypothetical protein